MEELNYFKEGWQHIISSNALDHQLFILALAALYTLKNWRQALVVVTAFTIGHSITLALSVWGMLNLNPQLVEVLIAGTIAVTAIANLVSPSLSKRNTRRNYFFALFFGTIHGLGFASFIRFTLAEGQNIGYPLFQFNVGLEAGQVVLIVALLLVAYLLIDVWNLNRRWWTIFISASVFLLSLKMLIERLFF
ncbi:MAG: HupE/UreJ family protein [Chitinophagaceae bacterium]